MPLKQMCLRSVNRGKACITPGCLCNRRVWKNTEKRGNQSPENSSAAATPVHHLRSRAHLFMTMLKELL